MRVSAHRSLRPMGTMADPQTRSARRRAHDAFDRIWRRGARRAQYKNRCLSYRWLADQFGVERIHIGEMGIEECERVEALCSDVSLADVKAWVRMNRNEA